MKRGVQRIIWTSILLLWSGMLMGAGSIVGDWKTIDDETGKTKSIVRITKTADDEFEGQVIEILHSDRGPNPKCDKCPGEFKGKPVKGLVILWGLKEDKENQYKGGEILDPTKGKIYKAKVELLENGKLKVRGFIGFALIGRSQFWEPAS